jgi:PKD repeat protein
MPNGNRVRSDATRRRGQSLVEFALILPILLLFLLMAIDFGRVYLGWVNLNNTARIAANLAATTAPQFASGSGPTFDAAFDRVWDQVQRDATAINCTLPSKAAMKATCAPAQLFPEGTDLGDPAHVAITCQFGLLTPIISGIIGSPLAVSASSDFPVRTGIIAGTPTGGGGGSVHADFTASPTSGIAPLTVTFTDASTGSPTTYAWDFDGDGTTDSAAASGNSFTYSLPGVYAATLTVSDGLSTDTRTRNITVGAPPGPVVAFTVTPTSGPAPLTVSFTNSSTGSGTLTYAWTFGDGGTSTSAVPGIHIYGSPGTYTVRLTVTDGFGQSNSGTKIVNVATPTCVVPDFATKPTGRMTNSGIQAEWIAAGFTTAVIFNPLPPPDYEIRKQSLKAGDAVACSSVLTVFNK